MEKTPRKLKTKSNIGNKNLEQVVVDIMGLDLVLTIGQTSGHPFNYWNHQVALCQQASRGNNSQ